MSSPPLRWLVRLLSTGVIPAALVAAGIAATAGSPAFGPLLPWLIAAGASAVAALALERRRERAIAAIDETCEAIGRGELGAQVKVPRGELERTAQILNYLSLLRCASEAETRKLYERVEESYLQTMLAFASVIETKDPYTRGHSRRVGEWAAAIGRELGLPESDVRHLRYGGVLHDIGKVGVIEALLVKESGLTDEEMHAVRAHPVVGASIVAGIPFLRPVIAAVRHHHERWDGKGYPDALRGEEIPLIARIVGAADVWDACTSKRPYQDAMPPEVALAVLRRLSGTQLDPGVVEAIERVARRKLGEVSS